MRQPAGRRTILSPGYAAEWRANVASWKGKRTATRSRIAKLSPGDVIKLSYTVKFGGISADTFTLIEFRKRTPIFAPVTHPAFLCRLRAATLAGATIEL